MTVIGVISGKGGVGKTTSAVNLGVTLSSIFKKKVLLIDSNFSTPDLGLHLGLYSFPYTLQDVLEKNVPFENSIYAHPSGIDLLPSSLSYGVVGTDIRGLKTCLKDATDYDYILVDSPPGLGNELLPILEICDELLVVSNPDIPAVTDSLRAIEISKRWNVPIRGIVLNKIRGEKYELSITEIESVFDSPIIATIPEDAKVRESLAQGNPIVKNYPYSHASVEFAKFGAYLVGEEYHVGFLVKIKYWIWNLLSKFSITREEKTQRVKLPAPSEDTSEDEIESKTSKATGGVGIEQDLSREMIVNELENQEEGGVLIEETIEVKEVMEPQEEDISSKHLKDEPKEGGSVDLSSKSVDVIRGVKGIYKEKLINAGFLTVNDLANSSIREVVDKTGLREPYVAYLISAATANVLASRKAVP